MLLPKFLCPNSCLVLCKKAIAAMSLPKQGKKKKFFFLIIVAMALLKMGEKIEWNYGNVIAENEWKKNVVA